VNRSSARVVTSSGGLVGRMERWRHLLHGVALARAILAGGGIALLAFAVARFGALGDGVTWSIAALAGFAAALAALSHSLRRPLSLQRAALWIEEREPRLRYALVTAVEPGIAPATLQALDRTIEGVEWEGTARRVLRRTLAAPLLMSIAGVLAVLALPRLDGVRQRAGAPGGGRESGPSTPAPLGVLVVEVAAPPYTGRATQRLESPALVRAYPGSRVVVVGAGTPGGIQVTLDSSALAVRATAPSTRPGANSRRDARPATGWDASFTSGTARALVRVQREGGESRLIALEPLVDSAPSVTLRLPARDSVLRVAAGAIPLAADVSDDLGLASARFEYIVSSGQGERFTFRSGSIGRLGAQGQRGALSGSLDLAALALAPGDVVHLRAVASDRNAIGGPGVGSSESRTLRIARADEYDSVAVEQAPPPEVDKSLLSQRMLINLTEALVKRERTLPREGVVDESRRIGRDQARLRKQVSDIIFSRLGDGAEGAGEHFHGDGHNHAEAESLGGAPLTPEQLLKAAEKATEISGARTDFEHDETPVVAINRPMLEAYNAMWDAGRSLEVGEPRQALPAMYAALAAIQRARAAERLYLRGAPPRVVVDLARVRLAGKDRGVPGERTARTRIDARRAVLLARFARSLDALERDPGAGVDSLLVLRLAVADLLPAAAEALEGAIGEVRASRSATDALLRARRALDDGLVSRNRLSNWGQIP